MSVPEIQYCPSTLQPGFSTYSPLAQQSLFGSRSKKVSHILQFGPPGKNSVLTREYNEKTKRISISGVQEKYSLRLQKNSLSLTGSGGTHLLKPVPAERIDRVTDIPANEHVSMQIATQVFGIKTAACGMIFFDDGSPAYITRRFDLKPDGSGKYQVEDFATLLSKTPEREGHDFKYNASYLDIAQQIQRHVAASPVVLLDFFRLLVFNYIIGNGDAHLKNFSVMETEQGDFVLSPAYDLLCTALHLDDGVLALHGGLYDGDHYEETYLQYGTYTGSSFLVFAQMAGIHPDLAGKTIDILLRDAPKAKSLVERSFLSEEAKARYMEVFEDRLKSLKIGEGQRPSPLT
ncbi:type II toxin-antitoxin system HipA family toxin [Dinghuibacter silviterrae]|uniref:Serine/threonine-protein kinase HipA n=1 Tax=Dinghuibacter silviterrae TaxID=1539049 RepID=A0A4R8DF47_9BACT|nr:HipA domain-containing protein [Dinghuibacter silviterrae]TDW96075.1 serine/threonine-protein kinase HipA [Dinghuibacter silviterrae]